MAAYAQFTQIEQDFSRIQKGLLPLNPPEPKPVAKEGRDIRACANEYKTNLVTLGLKPTSIAKYRSAIDDFVAVHPFAPDAANQTIAMYVRAHREPAFPVPARVWRRVRGARIRARSR